MISAKWSVSLALVPALLLGTFGSAAEVEPHWAFQPVRRPTPPPAPLGGNTLDAFLAAAHGKHGLKPAEPASRRVLIRRVSLDLIGLPPTPEEVAAFEADRRPDAYERLVERLLSSPHHGERWGRHWLDLARWAETEGYESNHPRPSAWRYRDYVVDSFNRDKPFDRFLTEQLAGDEMTPYADQNLIATGFLAAARMSSNEEDKWLQRNQMLVDVVNTTGATFLGLTIQCAQCHTHKFDPITLRDYYALMAYFLPGQPVNAALADPALVRAYEQQRPADHAPAIARRDTAFEKARQAFLAREIARLPDEQRQARALSPDRRSADEELLARQTELKIQATSGAIEKLIPAEERPAYDAAKKRIAEIEKVVSPPQTWAYFSPVHSTHRPTVLPSLGFYPLPYLPDELAQLRCYVHLRGEVHAIGPKVPAGPPTVFGPLKPSSARPGSRLELARWLTAPEHPLTARVWANRVWQWHFGRGLVATPSDLGVRGEKPTHPELLDWLADELIHSGWSTRHLHRLIVGSQAYRRSSQTDADTRRADPDNRWLTRWKPRRLESETIRDVMLAISGELDRRIGGPGVEQADQSTRRGLYLHHKRGRPGDLQSLFDGPNEAAESCPRRHTSTTSLQALFLLNHPFVLARAESLAAKLPTGLSRAEQIERIYQKALGRAPESAEREAAERFFTESRTEGALLRFSHAILNLNETVYLE